ncbi:hypothetical protein ACKKBG_A28965 [Auxenochlorella protothecoides x Auxenochlorella symbiontica]
MAPGSVDINVLPGKEAGLFRQLVKQYETKQYKKGLKTADAILKRFSEHGETLAMKGLLQNCLGHKEVAMDLVKRGVKNNLRSHVCWHVFGLIQQSDENFDEAMKCYKNALRIDRENLTILRDLAVLQIQMRDLPGFLETRQTLLELKATNRQNWLAFAVAHHLNGNHDVAVKVLDSYGATMDEEAAAHEPYETSEVLLYKAQILEEGGQAEEALAAIDAAVGKRLLKDRLGVLTGRARLLTKLGRTEEAEGVYWELLGINPENHQYHAGLRTALGLDTPDVQLTAEQRQRLSDIYARLQRKFPKSTAAKRIPLDFLTGEDFKTAIGAYVRPYLVRGVPSLFSDLRPLLADPAKSAALDALFEGLEASLVEGRGLPPLETASPASATAPSTTGPPSPEDNPLVWVRLFRAQVANLAGRSREALAAVDACLADCPGLPDALTVRAGVLGRAGDLAGAAEAADAARRADLADRFVNCAAVAAMFAAGRCADAEETAALFTREGEHTNNLYDMQATWYEVAAGRAYLARGDHGKALKRFLKVVSHFKEFRDDQFDFHNYCLRKHTLRAYMDLLRFEDELYSHPAYAEGAYGAIETYIQLHEAATKAAAAKAEAANGASAEDAKKARQKARKEEQRRAKEAAAAAAAEQEAAKKDGKPAAKGKKDPDPDGVQLAAAADPLGEAAALVQRLTQCAGDRLQTQALAAEVQLLRGRLLLALQAVQRAERLAGPGDASVHLLVLRLALAQEAQAAAGPAAGEGAEAHVAELLREGVAALRGEGAPDAAAYAERWRAAHAGGSLAQAAAALEAAALLRPAGVEEAAAAFVAAASPAGAGHDAAAAVHALLSRRLSVSQAAESWREACAAEFPLSNLFSPSSLADGVAALSIK